MQQGFLELFVTQTHQVLFGHDLVPCYALENEHYVLDVDDQGGELESCQEVTPGIVDYFVVVLLLGEGEMGALDEEVENSFEVGLIPLESAFDRLTLKQIGKLPLDIFPGLNYPLVLFFDLFPQTLTLLLIFLFIFLLLLFIPLYLL
jgi:hypothetical protein